MEEFTSYMCQISEFSAYATAHFMRGELLHTSADLLKISRRLDNAKAFLLSTFDETTQAVQPAEELPE